MVEVKGFKEGLEDVVAADSSICYIDGGRGILSYRGIDIHDLADKSTFEEVCFLLWEGRLPRREELEKARRELGQERTLPQEMLELLSSLVPHLTRRCGSPARSRRSSPHTTASATDSRWSNRTSRSDTPRTFFGC